MQEITDSPPQMANRNEPLQQPLGTVTGSAVWSKHLGRDIMAVENPSGANTGGFHRQKNRLEQRVPAMRPVRSGAQGGSHE
jgi:uncharacterized protein YbjQ (UPF0145 family)